MQKHDRVLTQNHFFVFAVILTSLAITPFHNLDAVTLPKFVLASIFAPLFALILLIREPQRIHWQIKHFVIITFPFFAVLMSVIVGISSQNLIGKFGRNTGLIFFLSMFLFLIYAMRKSNELHVIIVKSIVFVGFINAAYGLFQNFKIDFVDWNELGDPIIGTLGNSNFLSALLGMSAAILFSLILDTKSWKLSGVLCFLISFSLLIIYLSDSIQGFFVFSTGIIVAIYMRIFRSRNIFIQFSFWIIAISTSILIILGTFAKGPLSALMSQNTLRFRIDYWSAALMMAKEHLLRGVGLDGFGDYYLEYRTTEAALRRGPNFVSNSAHNVFLDILAGGGIFLLISYLIIVLMAVLKIILYLRSTKVYEKYYIAIFAAWLGYIAQSLISINQIGLSIWGWILTGLVLGMNPESRKETPSNSKVNKSKSQVLFLSLLLLFNLGLNSVFSISQYRQDFNFRSAIDNGNANHLITSSLQWPSNIYYLNFGSQVLLNNNFSKESTMLARKSVEINRRNIVGWINIYENQSNLELEREVARREISNLDPLSSYYIKQK